VENKLQKNIKKSIKIRVNSLIKNQRPRIIKKLIISITAITIVIVINIVTQV